jgi:RimJ/RimL family protein N-acetyltransferase
MRENANIQLIGKHVVLVPFRSQYVPKYHEWMKDPWIQEMTASEELSLEEEYAAQESWLSDDSKLTFIVLDATHKDAENGSVEAMAGDVNIILNCDGGAEVMVMIAEESCRRKGLAQAAVELIIWFVHMKRNISRFFCKISSKNTASLTLFEKKLGWTRCGYAECFDEVELEFIVVLPPNTKMTKPDELLHVRPFTAPSPAVTPSSPSAGAEDVHVTIPSSAVISPATSRIKSKYFQTSVGDGLSDDIVINGQVMLFDGTCFVTLTSAEPGVHNMGSLNVAFPSVYESMPISSLLLGDLGNDSNAISTLLAQLTKMPSFVSCSIQADLAMYASHISRCIFMEVRQLQANLPAPPK